MESPTLLHKKELIARIAGKTGHTKKQVESMIAATFEAITHFMAEGKKVNIRDFGTFYVKDVPERKGVNPGTKEATVHPQHKRVKFKAGVVLKGKI